ncbi:MAG TPA: N-formylglutamate amidohydrolase [Rhodospirillales bacterium]
MTGVSSATAARAAALIGPGDPRAFEIVNPTGRTPLQLVCDHASRRVPATLGDLGLAEAHFHRHIAYDIGAADVTRALADALDAPAVLAGYSRLVIDVNRPPGHPECIPEISDATVIPGNQGLNEAVQRRRVTELFEPYHDAIHEAIATLWRRSRPPALFSVHSFSPRFGSEARPWDVGVLWNRDPRIAQPLMEKLSARGLSVGDNLPYSGRKLAYTINMHGGASGLANCVVEINQDQVADQAGVERWTGILAEVMDDILALEGLHRVQQY